MSTDNDPESASTGPSAVRAYLQLLRLPNVFTALADVAMGLLVAGGALDNWHVLVPLGIASAGLYLAGMVLNDWFDAELDARERPSRPIPSGAFRRRPRSGWDLACWLSASAPVGRPGSAAAASGRALSLPRWRAWCWRTTAG